MEPKQTFSQREIAWRPRELHTESASVASLVQSTQVPRRLHQHVARQCIKTKTPSGLPMSIDFQHQTKRNLEFLVAAHKDLVERIDPNAQAQKATEAASAAQAAAAQAAAAAELTVAAKPLLDKLDAIESRLKAIENKQGSCCVVS